MMHRNRFNVFKYAGGLYDDWSALNITEGFRLEQF